MDGFMGSINKATNKSSNKSNNEDSNNKTQDIIIKRSTVLINLSEGGVVDMSALAKIKTELSHIGIPE